MVGSGKSWLNTGDHVVVGAADASAELIPKVIEMVKRGNRTARRASLLVGVEVMPGA
jgi:hypothetical protein